MKNLYLYLIFLVTFAIGGCSKHSDEVTPINEISEDNPKIENKDKQLQYLVDYINKKYGENYSSNQRLANSVGSSFGEIKLDSVIKTFNKTKDRVAYTIQIERKEQFYGFENLVLVQVKGGFMAYILQYIPDQNFNKKIGDEDFLVKFTGSIRQLDLSNNMLAEYEIKDGKGQGRIIHENARMMGSCIVDVRIYTIHDTFTGPVTGSEIPSGYSTTVIELTYGYCASDPGGGGSGSSSSYGDYIPSGEAIGGGGGGSQTGPGGDPSIGILTPSEPLSREEMLELKKIEIEYHLRLNPYGLLKGGKDQYANWKQLVDFTPPQEVINRLSNLNQNLSFWQTLNPYGTWNIQSLQNAKGVIANLDFFGVTITKLPTRNGIEMTPAELLYEIRKELVKANPTIIDPSLAKFQPHPNLPNDGSLWLSNNPLTSILSIKMVDNGSVITSNSTDSRWIFTTLQAPNDSQHPVSGNREFGIAKMANGNYVIYTRGVDRATGILDSFMQFSTSQISGFFKSPFDLYFDSADEVWESFQKGVQKYIKDNNGSSTIESKVGTRVDYIKLNDLLHGNIPTYQILD